MARPRGLVYGTAVIVNVFLVSLVYGSEQRLDLSLQVSSKPPYYQGQIITYQSLVKHKSSLLKLKAAENVTVIWLLPSFISYKNYHAGAKLPIDVMSTVNQITMKFGSLGPSETINILINVTVDPSATFRDNRFHYATISTTVKYRWSDPCTKQENSNKVVHFPFFCPECSSFGAVGIENGTIKDSQIQASTFQIYPPNTKSWVPMTSFLHLNTQRRMKLNFYQIDLRFSREFAMAVIDGVPKQDPIPWNIIQLSSSEDEWKWKMLHAHQRKTTFSSHNSNEVSVAIAMSKPIKTRYLRISIPPFGNTNGNGQVYNVEVYACNPNSFLPNQDTANPLPVGIESSSLVPDSRFSSPSSLSPQCQPRLGRLNTKAEGGSWCASSCSAIHYLQIDLGETWTINEIENQGRHTTSGALIAVKTYSLSSSLDGISWTPYKNNGGTKIFWGNDVANFATRHKLSKPLTAKYVRFEPRTCTGNVACMRVEMYGAKASAVQKEVLPATLFGRSMLLEPTKNVVFVCNTEVQKEKAHCFSSKDKGQTWREISVQVLSVVAFDSSEQRLYGLTRNGKNILKSKDPNGDQWRGIPLKKWYSVRDRSTVYTAVEIPFVPISRNVTNVIEPLVQMTAYNGDKWQADQVGVYYKPVGGTSTMVLSFLPYSPDLSSNPCHTGVCVHGSCEHFGGSRFKCYCILGYTGRLCDTVFNYCSSNPCQNGGTCSSQFRSFTCKCQPGYSGETCQDYDECVSSPCLNGATCIDGHNKFTCTCPANYRGTTCQDFDECSSSPCQNGGTCTDGSSSYTCSCLTGYSGVNCQVTPCSTNPCRNGGTCVIKSGGGYFCKCDIQYSGTHCMNGRFVISRGSRSSSQVWTYSSGKYDKIVFYSNTNLTIFGVCLSDTHASSATCTHDTRIRKEGSGAILVSKSGNIYCQLDDVYVSCPQFSTPFLMVADTRYIIEVRMTSTKNFRKVVNGGLYASKTKTLSDGPLSFTYNYETVDSTELADSNGSTQSEGGIVGLSVQVAH